MCHLVVLGPGNPQEATSLKKRSSRRTETNRSFCEFARNSPVWDGLGPEALLRARADAMRLQPVHGVPGVCAYSAPTSQGRRPRPRDCTLHTHTWRRRHWGRSIKPDRRQNQWHTAASALRQPHRSSPSPRAHACLPARPPAVARCFVC